MSTNLIKPTVGRVVWYWPSPATMAVHDMFSNEPTQPMAAHVAYVWHDRMVNLVAYDHKGKVHALPSVSLIQPGDDVPEGRDFCQWMPHQVKEQGQVITATVESTEMPIASPAVLSLEQAIREHQADVAPRVTMEDIEANIKSEHCFTAWDGVMGVTYGNDFVQDKVDSEGMAPGDFVDSTAYESLRLMTVCVLILRNGFTVVGTSAVASPANFNAEIGRRLARERAIDQIWPLMGYDLRTKLFLTERIQSKSTEAQAETA